MQRSTKGYAHSPSRGPSPSRRRRSSSLTWGRSRGRWRTCTSRRSCTATSSRPTCSTASTRVDTYGLRTVRTYGLRVPASCVLRTEGSGQLALGGGGAYCTYAVHVPASGVPYAPRTVAPPGGDGRLCVADFGLVRYHRAPLYLLWRYLCTMAILTMASSATTVRAYMRMQRACSPFLSLPDPPPTLHPAPRAPRPAPRAPRNLTRACTPLPSSWPIAAQSPMRPRT